MSVTRIRPEAHGEICQTDPCPRCVEALLRHKEALVHLQRAQDELNAACAKLSSLVGVLPQWRRAGTLADQVRALWYRVSDRRDRVTLDGIAEVRS